jgi:hypothetical protein
VEGRDHLRRLSFDGLNASRGSYTPERTELHLLGTDRVQHLVVRMHEAHHIALNDSTAWGTALHVVSRLGPGHDDGFVGLLDMARVTHESFATYASVSVALARHALAAEVLATYPAYAPLHRATGRLLVPVAGEHRRYLMATALARVAMQTPIIEALVDSLTLPAREPPRWLDTPDGRWRWLMRAGASIVAAAAADADDLVRQRGEEGALAADGRDDAEGTAEDGWDEAWVAWEAAAYEVAAAALRTAGATVLPYDGHQEGTKELVARAVALRPDLGLRADAMEGAPDDRALAGATITGVRMHHAPELWGARLLPVAPSEIVAHRQGHVVGGQPTLVLDARLSTRLARLYRWPAEERDELLTERRARVDVRLIGDDDGEDVVLHSPLATPEAATDLVGEWHGRGPALSIVGVSCLADRGWSTDWWDVLADRTEVVMLVDVALDHFVGSWSRDARRIGATHIAIADEETHAVHGLVLAPEGSSIRWLYLGDEVSASLLRYQLDTTPGVEVVDDPGLPEREGTWVQVVVTHLLATESFTDLDGLEGYL